MGKKPQRGRPTSALEIERTQLAGAVEDVEGKPTRLKADEKTGALRVCLLTWDTKELEWVRQPFMDIRALTEAINTLTSAVNDLKTAIEAM